MPEKIQLSAEQITDLYKDHLLQIEPQAAPDVNETTTPALDYKGGFQKKILWIHTEPHHTYIQDDDFEMLTKILDACRLTWKDIALVNLAPPSLDMQDVIDRIGPDMVISSLKELPDYQVISRSGIKMLDTHPLPQIRNDKALKLHLWQALKILFQLS